MLRRCLLTTFLFAATVLAGTSASATPIAIVDTGAPAFSPLDGGLGGPLSQWIAVEFTVSQSWIISEVQGWIDPRDSGDIRFRLYSDGGDVPGATLFEQLLPITGSGATGWYGPSGLNWSITSGSYWLAFETPDTFGGGMPLPAATPLPNAAYQNTRTAGYIANDSFTPAVRVFAEAPQATAVPEPASLLLIGTGLAGLVARRRRARRS